MGVRFCRVFENVNLIFFLASVPLDKGSKIEDLVTKIRVRKGLKVNARNFLKAFVDHDICI